MSRILAARPAVALASFALLAACTHEEVAQSQPPMATTQPQFVMTQTAVGPALTTSDGMTVYTYDDDSPGRSTCYEDCAEYWPPVLATPEAHPTGSLTLIPRDDGSMQWAVRGMPLYTYVQDHGPGDANGENYKGEWHVVR